MLKIDEILKATAGMLLSDGRVKKVSGVSIDSRRLSSGNLFIAIEGKYFDGHRFILQAIEKGAKVILASKPTNIGDNISLILVKDTTKALGDIAAFYRSKFNIPLIAVTGSAGKTTTKEMIFSLLKSKFKVLRNIKTENNQYGVPLTLFRLKKTHQAIVLELGTNSPGEIDRLSCIVKPTVIVYTNIGESHLKGLKDLQGVYREKFQALKHLKKDGVVIFNADDKFLKKILGCEISANKVTYAIDNKNTSYQAKGIVHRNNQLEFSVRRNKFHLKNSCRHNIYNALAAVCCGRLFKISYNNMNIVLQRFKNCEGRQKIEKLGGGIHLIDDTYNSNPISFKSAIDTLDAFMLKKGGKKFLICADMLELGVQSKFLHEKMGDYILAANIDFIITKGTEAKYIYQRIKESPSGKKVFHSLRWSEIYGKIERYCSRGDMILVKGSRSMNMDKVVNYIKSNFT